MDEVLKGTLGNTLSTATEKAEEFRETMMRCCDVVTSCAEANEEEYWSTA